VPRLLSQLSACLQLRSWSQSPEIESHIESLAQRGICLSLRPSPFSCFVCLTLSHSNHFLKKSTKDLTFNNELCFFEHYLLSVHYPKKPFTFSNVLGKRPNVLSLYYVCFTNILIYCLTTTVENKYKCTRGWESLSNSPVLTTWYRRPYKLWNSGIKRPVWKRGK